MFPKAFKTDIIRMYRQLLFHHDHHHYHAFLFRFGPDQPIVIILILTVIYGEAPAAFMALQVLRQRVVKEGHRIPLAVAAILRHSYVTVDDFLLRAFTEEELSRLKSETEDLLGCEGFALSKWASNVPGFCPSADCEEVFVKDQASHAALGVRWNPATDMLSLHLNLVSPAIPATKRTILSDSSKFFDPLDHIRPVGLSAKILLKDLWPTGGTRDDHLPPQLLKRWTKIREQLQLPFTISVPRWVQYTPESFIVLHGFCDASVRAYAAVIYVVILLEGKPVHTALLMSKSRVAPLKTVSVPRLELYGLMLLTRLLRLVVENLHVQVDSFHAWTDSQVTRAWVYQPSSA